MSNYVEVPQDTHLAANQADEIRCGDNGIFRGMPVTDEQVVRSAIARSIYARYVERYEKAKARYDELAAIRKDKQTRAGAIDRFIAELRKREELLTVFDNRLWLTVLDYAEVRRDGMLTFHFFDGTEIGI